MEELFLKEITLDDEKDVIELIKEYVEAGSEINGLPGTNSTTFLELYQILQTRKNMVFETYEQNTVPAKTYLIKRKSDDKVVGNVSIRFNLTRSMDENFAGHIGYAIRPSERRKGYAVEGLKLALQILKNSGVKTARVGCLSDNIGSKKTILKNNGVLIGHKEALKSEDYYEIQL